MLTEPEEPPDRARRGSVKSDDLEHFDATIKARVKAAVALGADAIVVSASELATARGRVDARATGDWARTVSAVGMGKHLAPDDPSAFIVCTPAASLVLRAGSAADRDAWVDAIASCLPGQHKRAKFPTSKAHISAVFHSFRLIFGRAIISWNGLEAWVCFPVTRARGTLTLKRT